MLPLLVLVSNSAYVPKPAFCEEPEQLDPVDCVGVLERCLPGLARPLHFSNKPAPITHSLKPLQDQRLSPVPGCFEPRWLCQCLPAHRRPREIALRQNHSRLLADPEGPDRLEELPAPLPV